MKPLLFIQARFGYCFLHFAESLKLKKFWNQYHFWQGLCCWSVSERWDDRDHPGLNRSLWLHSPTSYHCTSSYELTRWPYHIFLRFSAYKPSARRSQWRECINKSLCSKGREYRSIPFRPNWTPRSSLRSSQRCRTRGLQLDVAKYACRRCCLATKGSLSCRPILSHARFRNRDRGCRSRLNLCQKHWEAWSCFSLQTRRKAGLEKTHRLKRESVDADTFSFISAGVSWSRPLLLLVRRCRVVCCRYHWNER